MCARVCVCVGVRVCACVPVCMCTYVCVCVCVCVCACVRFYVYTKAEFIHFRIIICICMDSILIEVGRLDGP